jgi:hypothetical protein
MVKAVDRSMVIGDIRLMFKRPADEVEHTNENSMNVLLVGVISPVAAWSMPRASVGSFVRTFPQHTFLEAWDGETLRRLLPDADVAFTRRSIATSWVASAPAVGAESGRRRRQPSTRR